MNKPNALEIAKKLLHEVNEISNVSYLTISQEEFTVLCQAFIAQDLELKEALARIKMLEAELEKELTGQSLERAWGGFGETLIKQAKNSKLKEEK